VRPLELVHDLLLRLGRQLGEDLLVRLLHHLRRRVLHRPLVGAGHLLRVQVRVLPLAVLVPLLVLLGALLGVVRRPAAEDVLQDVHDPSSISRMLASVSCPRRAVHAGRL